MSDSETVTLRVYRGRHNTDSPDATHEVPLHRDLDFRHEAETVTLSDDISHSGWMGFDLVDLPDGLDVATLNVHHDDSFHDPSPLDTRAVERGLVFDGDYLPGEDPPMYRLRGIVEAYVEAGGR